jgi:hypothetical protein
MPRLTGAVAFALATVLLTAASQQPTTPPPVRTGSPAAAAVTEQVPAPAARGAATAVPAAAPVPVVAPTGTAIADEGCNGGVLEFGKLIVCDAVVDAEQHTYTFSTVRAGSIAYRYVTGTEDARLHTEIVSSTGAFVCTLFASWLPSTRTCGPLAPGTYRVVVKVADGIGTAGYSLMADYEFDPVRPCAALGDEFHAFGGPGVTGVADPRALGDCYTITQPEGTRLMGGHGDSRVLLTIWAADHREVCTLGESSTNAITVCTLTGPGPYLMVPDTRGEYTIRLPRLTDPAGCAELPAGGFGEGNLRARDGVSDGGMATCHEITARAGQHLIRLSGGYGWYWTLYDRAGTAICDYLNPRQTCLLPASGRYSLLVSHADRTPAAYRAAVVRLDDGTGCAAPISVGFDVPAVTGGSGSAVQTNCHVIDAKPGDRVLMTFRGATYSSSTGWVADGTGTAQCIDAAADPCVLTGTAPYRLIAVTPQVQADDLYQARVTRLNGATGCPEITPSGYGTVAGAYAPLFCRSLRIPAAGAYRTAMISSQNSSWPGSVYDAAGRKVCDLSLKGCTYPAAGTYTAVVQPATFQFAEDRWVTVLVPVAPSAGCVEVSDQGATYRGSFAQFGEFDCVRLPSPSGTTLTATLPDDAGGTGLVMEGTLVNAAGTPQCDLATLRHASCTLSGPAPFHLVFNSTLYGPTGTYVVSVLRVDGAANGCKALPSGDPGLTVTLTKADRNLGCVSVPAGAHAATELIHWRRLTGRGDTEVRVFDSTGKQLCRTTDASAVGELRCALPAGPITVVLVPDDTDAKYRVSRRPG